MVIVDHQPTRPRWRTSSRSSAHPRTPEQRRLNLEGGFHRRSEEEISGAPTTGEGGCSSVGCLRSRAARSATSAASVRSTTTSSRAASNRPRSRGIIAAAARTPRCRLARMRDAGCSTVASTSRRSMFTRRGQRPSRTRLGQSSLPHVELRENAVFEQRPSRPRAVTEAVRAANASRGP